MRILLASMELQSLTGQPTYTKFLAKGLKELGHEVRLVGLENGLRAVSGHYDIALIAENIPEYLKYFTADKIFNICHSKDEADEPILDTRITKFLAPRQDVINHWQKEYEDCELEFDILPNPMDFSKWEVKREKQDKYIILSASSICSLRRPMFIDLISRANKDTEVWIVGKNHGGLDGIEIPNNVKIFPETDNLVEYMKKADEVAGIFVGRVTLEAQIMGIKTSVYDEKGNWEYVEPNNLEKHNYKKVAEQLCKMTEN